ncbi:unnamed protein product [Vitrella brassicaformis CCMP3155]|uniref:Uncharacterized protein n=1 Tax=Vitrella brassicaformis (strain CCMP3155) TaxID=1169540 RepID=A0A0G4F866_VITBC|nr:unnamed protein product [Vitrella brassicaformis CCMP3155]|eukprot:CEM08908.1 unnamed protein product [Vitrella brassicaformis CCMP3155]
MDFRHCPAPSVIQDYAMPALGSSGAAPPCYALLTRRAHSLYEIYLIPNLLPSLQCEIIRTLSALNVKGFEERLDAYLSEYVIGVRNCEEWITYGTEDKERLKAGLMQLRVKERRVRLLDHFFRQWSLALCELDDDGRRAALVQEHKRGILNTMEHLIRGTPLSATAKEKATTYAECLAGVDWELSIPTAARVTEDTSWDDMASQIGWREWTATTSAAKGKWRVKSRSLNAFVDVDIHKLNNRLHGNIGRGTTKSFIHEVFDDPDKTLWDMLMSSVARLARKGVFIKPYTIMELTRDKDSWTMEEARLECGARLHRHPFYEKLPEKGHPGFPWRWRKKKKTKKKRGSMTKKEAGRQLQAKHAEEFSLPMGFFEQASGSLCLRFDKAAPQHPDGVTPFKRVAERVHKLEGRPAPPSKGRITSASWGLLYDIALQEARARLRRRCPRSAGEQRWRWALEPEEAIEALRGWILERREAIMARPLAEEEEEADEFVEEVWQELDPMARLLRRAEELDNQGPRQGTSAGERPLDWVDRLAVGCGTYGVVEEGLLRQTTRVAIKSVWDSLQEGIAPTDWEVMNFERETRAFKDTLSNYLRAQPAAGRRFISAEHLVNAVGPLDLFTETSNQTISGAGR